MISVAATLIYGLIDPRDGSIRYVGKTTLPLAKRLNRHLAVSKTRRSHSAAWLRSLIRDGLRPEVEVLETVPADGDWTEAECFWIGYFRMIGARLCNHTAGGEGSAGFRPTEDARSKLRARKQMPEARARVSRQSLDLWQRKRSEVITAQNAGKGSGWKQKQSDLGRRRFQSSDHPFRVASRERVKLTGKDIESIKELVAVGIVNAEIARQFEVDPSMISHIKAGRKRQSG